MATTEKTDRVKKIPAQKINHKSSDGRKWFHLFLFLFGLTVFVILALIGIYAMRKVLFSRNVRFSMRSVSVDSCGFWQNKAVMLRNRLQIAPNANLFELDMAELLNRIKKIPGVERGSVRRVLPDQLHIQLMERIPRAVLGNPGSAWVVDEFGVVIPRRESMVVAYQLPVIVGLGGRKFSGGEELPELKSALALIMQTVRSFPDISIRMIDVRHADRLMFLMSYRNLRSCRVLFPRESKNLNYLLSSLQSAIIRSERRGDSRNTFDMTFDGNVIIR